MSFCKYNTIGNKKDIQYVLESYEKYLRGNFSDIPVFTIEHIYKDSGKDKHCKVGNLMCLEEELNNRAGNKSVSYKVEKIYPFSVFLSASEIVKSYKSSFDEPEIQERGKKIANILFEKIWVNKSIEP